MTGEETFYRFLPGARRGLRPSPSRQYESGSTPPERGSTTVDLAVQGRNPNEAWEDHPVSVDVDLYGPGDVVGLDRRQVVRTEPTDGATDFPPNYFPHVEFDRPDLPWLFSPERANADADYRVRPWLSLVVVERQEGIDLGSGVDRPLDVLEFGRVEPGAELPPPSETWAWAHAQVVGDSDEVAREPVAETLGWASTATVSRLVCARNLEANTAYNACVVPTFEAGRLAGLGEDPSDPPSGRSPTTVAWAGSPSTPFRLPVYYHWEFATGPRGDFESLVRALEPRVLGDDVGARPVDLSDPGPEPLAAPALAPLEDGGFGEGASGDGTSDDASGGGTSDDGREPLLLDGAIRSPSAAFDEYPPELRVELRSLLNRPADLATETDAVVGPPIYGQWHAGVDRLPEDASDLAPRVEFLDSWLDQLNLDPRRRIAAGFGTVVVREDQESLMASAWDQFGDLRDANRLVRSAQVAGALGEVVTDRLAGVPPSRLLGLTGPMHPLLTVDPDGPTLRGLVRSSPIPDRVVRPAFRRIARPTGPLSRRLDVGLDAATVVDDALDPGRVRAPHTGLKGRVRSATDRLGLAGPDLAGGVTVAGGPDTGAIRGGRQPMALTAVDDETAVVRTAHGRLGSVADHCATARSRLSEIETALWGTGVVADGGRDADATAAVHALVTEQPTVVDHCEAIAGSTFRPLAWSLARLLAVAPDRVDDRFDVLALGTYLERMGALHDDLMATVDDLVERLRDDPTDRKAALAEIAAARDTLSEITTEVDEIRAVLPRGEVTAYTISAESAPPGSPPSASALALEEVPAADRLIDPEAALVDAVSDRLQLPRDWFTERRDPLEEIMAAPEFDRPMYEPLRDLSTEYVLPGIGNVPGDTVGLLETNPPFVEAYMVGLSHEFARELLWRRFPTDRRGTYFRYFWDSRGDPDTAGDGGPPPDIEYIHTWGGSDLGANAPGEDEGQVEPEERHVSTVVLIVRGGLLRRYPKTRIYAAKAVKETNATAEGVTVEDRVPLLERRREQALAERRGDGPIETLVGYDEAQLERWPTKDPDFRGSLGEDVTFLGFDLRVEDARAQPVGPNADDEVADDELESGWFFVFEEPPGEPRFGLDVPTEEDFGAVPHGVRTGGEEPDTMTDDEFEDGEERGWDGLSWGHLASSREELGQTTHVRVEGPDASRPGRSEPPWAVEDGDTWYEPGGGDGGDSDEAESGSDGSGDGAEDEEDGAYTFAAEDAARWGANSAHIAQITWQRPVRVAVHADDMLEEG